MGMSDLFIYFKILCLFLQIFDRSAAKFIFSIFQQTEEYTRQRFCIIISTMRNFFIIGNMIIPGNIA